MSETSFDPAPDYAHPDMPPLTPGADELGSSNDQLAQKSHDHASETITSLKLEILTELVTESAVWGTIWRADFKFPRSSTLVNRMMSWERNGKFFFSCAVGQNVPPLPQTHAR